MSYYFEELEVIDAERHKHLIINHDNLFECFIKLTDVRKHCPEFKHKEKFQKSSQRRLVTKEYYVKCEEVKQNICEKVWNKILTDSSVNWFREFDKDKREVDFVKCKSKANGSRQAVTVVKSMNIHRSQYSIENFQNQRALQA